MTETYIPAPSTQGKFITIGIGHRMVLLREELGLTLEQFADRIGIARSTLTEYEKGRSIPKPIVIDRIREVFDYNPQWIVTGVAGPEMDSKKLLAEPKKARLQHRGRKLCISAPGVLRLDQFRSTTRATTHRQRRP